jgi:hypothetical protein
MKINNVEKNRTRKVERGKGLDKKTFWMAFNYN